MNALPYYALRIRYLIPLAVGLPLTLTGCFASNSSGTDESEALEDTLWIAYQDGPNGLWNTIDTGDANVAGQLGDSAVTALQEAIDGVEKETFSITLLMANAETRHVTAFTIHLAAEDVKDVDLERLVKALQRDDEDTQVEVQVSNFSDEENSFSAHIGYSRTSTTLSNIEPGNVDDVEQLTINTLPGVRDLAILTKIGESPAQTSTMDAQAVDGPSATPLRLIISRDKQIPDDLGESLVWTIDLNSPEDDASRTDYEISHDPAELSFTEPDTLEDAYVHFFSKNNTYVDLTDNWTEGDQALTYWVTKGDEQSATGDRLIAVGEWEVETSEKISYRYHATAFETHGLAEKPTLSRPDEFTGHVSDSLSAGVLLPIMENAKYVSAILSAEGVTTSSSYYLFSAEYLDEAGDLNYHHTAVASSQWLTSRDVTGFGTPDMSQVSEWNDMWSIPAPAERLNWVTAVISGNLPHLSQVVEAIDSRPIEGIPDIIPFEVGDSVAAVINYDPETAELNPTVEF
ncbi:hypothetical protein [Ectothiorhodospira marina]|uniref:Uncharacterized protein n=1 Tax=Ectothiorhodospira marina TaxID=1396821 RepID=A0A1H7K1S7_9GAMM|nr:hypothetical protein [Ectothiorhodospira marina]SEK80891.1 hypothetical protein SAMN05444515_105109 [Ectothiorhodospira marina]